MSRGLKVEQPSALRWHSTLGICQMFQKWHALVCRGPGVKGIGHCQKWPPLKQAGMGRGLDKPRKNPTRWQGERVKEEVLNGLPAPISGGSV